MSVRRSVFWAFAGQIASFATMLATSIVIARLLSPREMGIYAVAFAAVGVLQVLAAFDATTYVVREKDLAQRTLDAAFTVNAALSIAVAGLTYGLSFVGAAFLGEPAVAKALQFLAFGPLMAMFEFRPSAMLQREMRFKAISMVTVGRTIVASAVSIATAYAGFSYMSLAWGYLASGAFGMIMFNVIESRHLRLRLCLDNWRAIGVFGLRMMSIAGLANLVSRLSDIILGRILGLVALGLYSRASTIANLVFQNVYGTATKVVFIQLAKDYRERGVLRDTFLRGIQMITAVMWPLLIGFAVLSRPAVYILFGEKWLAAATPLSLLLIAQFVVLAFGMNWELFVLRDETARQTRYEAIRAIVSLVLLTIGCMISMSAAAASRIVEALVGLCLYLPHMNRMAGTTSGELLSAYGQSALLTVAAVLPSALLMISYDWAASTPVPLIAGCVGLGVLLWLGMIVLLGHPLRAELVLIVNRLRGGRPAAS